MKCVGIEGSGLGASKWGSFVDEEGMPGGCLNSEEEGGVEEGGFVTAL